jgi:hypothetical protein
MAFPPLPRTIGAALKSILSQAPDNGDVQRAYKTLSLAATTQIPNPPKAMFNAVINRANHQLALVNPKVPHPGLRRNARTRCIMATARILSAVYTLTGIRVRDFNGGQTRPRNGPIVIQPHLGHANPHHNAFYQQLPGPIPFNQWPAHRNGTSREALIQARRNNRALVVPPANDTHDANDARDTRFGIWQTCNGFWAQLRLHPRPLPDGQGPLLWENLPTCEFFAAGTPHDGNSFWYSLA